MKIILASPIELLSKRELQIVEMLTEGLFPNVVAILLGISPNTVKRHIDNALGVTGTHNITHLCVLYWWWNEGRFKEG
jgi:DNA-binding CsgD family transcriptional regulator